MLVWFALSIGVAIASPLVRPQSMQLICSGTGAMVVVTSNADGTLAASSHTLDCPLCASMGAPPPIAVRPMEHEQLLAYAMQGIAYR